MSGDLCQLCVLPNHLVRDTLFLQDLFGDGFAIWYAKDRMENGPVFGSKDYFSGT
jgi:phosphotransferase system IIA component